MSKHLYFVLIFQSSEFLKAREALGSPKDVLDFITAFDDEYYRNDVGLLVHRILPDKVIPGYGLLRAEPMIQAATIRGMGIENQRGINWTMTDCPAVKGYDYSQYQTQFHEFLKLVPPVYNGPLCSSHRFDLVDSMFAK